MPLKTIPEAVQSGLTGGGSMDFAEKYSLIDRVPGEGTKSYRARQRSTGREVTVHLLVGGPTADNSALLERLRNLPPQAMAKLIEVGDNERGKFVVTVAPPYLHLSEWLDEQERAAPPAPVQGIRAGMWKAPVGRPVPEMAEATPPPSATPVAREAGEFTKIFEGGGKVPAADDTPFSDEPGVFTRMFQAPAPSPPKAADLPKDPLIDPPKKDMPKPAPPPGQEPGEFTRLFQTPLERAPRVPKAVEPTPARAEEPGEFTRLFQAPVAEPAQQMPKAAKPPSAPKAANPPSPTKPEPGEFTRLFQPAPPKPVPPAPRHAPAPPPEPPGTAPGEFTRLFNSPLPQTPARDDWPAPEPKGPAAGEFTRMFQSPPPPVKPGPERQAPPASEFSKFFHPGAGAGSGPQLPSAAPFSSALPKSSPPEAPQPPANLSGGGGATQAFAIPKSVPPVPSGSPYEPSEYTRMMSVPAEPGRPLAIPHVPQSGRPQIPVIPPINVSPPLATQMPQLGGKAKAPPNLAMWILVLLAFLLVGIIVLLLMRH